MKVYTDYYSRARQAGKKTVADILTQSSMLKMEVGQTLCIASITGTKYFKCIKPPKRKLKIIFEEAEEISKEVFSKLQNG